MSTLEEFELALAKAQAAIAGLRRTPSADANDSRGAAPGAAPEPAQSVAATRRSSWLKAALILFCVGVAFLQYYYIDIALEIFSMPAAFRGPPR